MLSSFYYLSENRREHTADKLKRNRFALNPTKNNGLSVRSIFFLGLFFSRWTMSVCVYICVEKYNANNVCWCVCVSLSFDSDLKIIKVFLLQPLFSEWKWISMCVCVLLWDRSPLGHSLPLSDFVVSSLFFFLVYTHHHISLALFYLPKPYKHILSVILSPLLMSAYQYYLCLFETTSESLQAST